MAEVVSLEADAECDYCDQLIPAGEMFIQETDQAEEVWLALHIGCALGIGMALLGTVRSLQVTHSLGPLLAAYPHVDSVSGVLDAAGVNMTDFPESMEAWTDTDIAKLRALVQAAIGTSRRGGDQGRRP